MDQFLALDAKVYDQEHQVTKETTIRRLDVNPYTDITVTEHEHLVGYISLCPIKENIFNQIKRGEASEEDVEKHIIPFNRVGRYDAYLSSIVVDKNRFPYFKGTYLFLYLQNHLLKLQKRGIWINRIIAVAVSKAGKRMLEKFSFIEIEPNVFVYSCLEKGYIWFHSGYGFPSLYLLSFIRMAKRLFRTLAFWFHSQNLYVWDWDADT